MAIRLKTFKQMHDSGLIPWSKPTAWRLIKEGKLPPPALEGNAHLWDEEAVEVAMAKIIADAAQQRQRDDGQRLARKQALAAHARKSVRTTAA